MSIHNGMGKDMTESSLTF